LAEPNHPGRKGSAPQAGSPDIHTHWTKVHVGVIRALACIEKSLPFDLVSMKFDSGSEFMNYQVISYVRSTAIEHRKTRIEASRSRPYRKNGNCHVEQKNLTHVRQFIGYDRIDSQQATRILDGIYREL
jgi:hypothetical protein